MRVRDGRVRGLGLHLARLDAANREMFGTGLDGERIRGYVRHAVPDSGEAQVRVHVVEPEPGTEAAVLVVVRPAGAPRSAALSLKSVPYQRSVAHLKHLGDFGQRHYLRLVQRDGFDEALLTGSDGVISEGAITNVGFLDAAGVRWPDAPALAGTTRQLLEPRLPEHGLASRTGPVFLADLPRFAAAFVTSATGIAAVHRIDDLAIPVDAGLIETLRKAFDAVPWDVI